MKKYLPLLIIFTIIGLFYYPFFRHHLVPVPLDIVPGMYLPWLDRTIPVKNPLPSDVVSLTLPLRYLSVNLFRSGQWPLWNSQILSGTPLLATFQSASLSLFNILYLLPFSFLDVWSIQIILQPILAFLFFYLFISLYQKNQFAVITSSLIWAFNGFFALWFQYNTVVYAGLFLPLCLYSINKFSQNYLWGFLLAASLALSAISGNPPVTIIIICASIVYSLFYLYRQPSKLIFLSFFFILSLLYSSPQLSVGLANSQNSIRDSDQVALNSHIKYLPLVRLLTAISPDYFGHPSTRNTWIDQSLYDNLTIYNGILPLTLIILSLFIYPVLKSKLLLNYSYTITALSFLFMLPNIFSQTVGTWKFLGLNSMVFTRTSILYSFALSTISGLVLGHLITSKIKKPIISLLVLPLATTTMLVATFLISKYYQTVPYLDYNWQVQSRVALRNAILPCLLSISISFLIIIFIKFSQHHFTHLILLALFLVNTFDLYRFFYKYNSFTSSKYFYPSHEVLNYLGDHSFRFARENAQILPSNMWLMYPHLQTATGYDTTYSTNYGHFMSLLNSGNISGLTNRFVEIDNQNSHLINLLSLDHFLATKKDKFELSVQGKLSPSIAHANFELVKDYGTYQLLKNNQALPFVRSVKKIVFSPDLATTKELLLGPQYDQIAILSDNLDSSPELDSEVVISQVNQLSQSVTFTTNSSALKPSFITISQNYDPNWTASIDGQSTRIYQTNLTFQGLLIPSGRHLIRLSYQPKIFYYSLFISAISLILSLLVILISSLWPKITK
ncbi:MAG: YfhO family protein [Microgenomates group bacterium]